MKKEQFEKLRLISYQDISIFEKTPIYQVFNKRKEAAVYFLKAIGEEQKSSALSIIEWCDDEIKKFLIL